MTKQELTLLAQLDDICMRQGCNYKIESQLGIGVSFTVLLRDDLSMKFGGFDTGMVGCFEDAIEALSKLNKRRKKEK